MQITTLPLDSLGSPGPVNAYTGTNGRTDKLEQGQPLAGVRADAPVAQPLFPASLSPASPPRTGLGLTAPLLNQQVGRGQQVLGYLGRLQAQLETLKRDLSTQLSLPTSEAPVSSQISHQLADFNNLWQKRQQVCNNSLDNQLRFQADGQGRQSFKVRGLDTPTLQRSEKETLSFTTGAEQADRRIVTAVLDANQPLESRVHKLDQTLGVANIRVHRDAQGELTLSAPETSWPSVQTGFGVRGGGIRFPASQFHRLKLEPEPAALRPETWKLDDQAALRQTLQNVLQAQQLVKQSQTRVAQTLTGLSNTLDSIQLPVDGAWANSFVQDFERISQQPAYTQLSTIGPAVLGISRDRVERLLALGDS